MKRFTTAIFLMLAASTSANSVGGNISTLSHESSVEPNHDSSTATVLDEIEISETQDMCPMDVKECPDGSWVNRNPKKKCKFSKCKSAPKPKPTRKPTKPTRKPTKRPTGRSSSTSTSSKSSKSSSNSRDSRKCVDDERPRPRRSGVGRFRFKLMKSNAQCVDSRDDLYEYGRFDKVREFSDCADACVNDVRKELLDTFRGYEWDCSKRECRCLYDRGTLSSRNSGRFDRTSRSGRGRGSIEDTEFKRDMYCAKLAGAEFYDVDLDEHEEYQHEEVIQAQARRAVRGYNN